MPNAAAHSRCELDPCFLYVCPVFPSMPWCGIGKQMSSHNVDINWVLMWLIFHQARRNTRGSSCRRNANSRAKYPCGSCEPGFWSQGRSPQVHCAPVLGASLCLEFFFFFLICWECCEPPVSEGGTLAPFHDFWPSNHHVLFFLF